jgi:hypothetical protein
MMIRGNCPGSIIPLFQIHIILMIEQRLLLSKIFKEVIKMTEYEENLIDRQQMEIQRLQRETEDVGFMEAYFSYIPGFGHAQNNQGFVRDQIKETLTAKEYDILRRTRFTSGKDQIEAYVEIIQRLLKAGVFDQHGLTPLNPWGSSPTKVEADSSSAKQTCKCKDKDGKDCIKALLAAFEKAVEEMEQE